jgi:DNA (cytosine-5)-methyltransferase 1
MNVPQSSVSLNGIIIDHFCGGGGASTGISLALGRPVDIAVNRDPSAIAMHSANHKDTYHYQKDVFDVDPLEAVKGREVLLMWGSPDCTHFSRAKGGTPLKKEVRSLAWVMVEWAEAVRPKVIMLENVPEFTTWCPLTPENRPDKTKTGETFKEFVAALRGLGYEVEWRVLAADDYGAGTSRKRLYLVARRDGNPIVFPTPTHGERNGLKPKHTAAEYIDFELRAQSVFNRGKPLVDATLKRIARGLNKFTIRNDNPFIIPLDCGEKKRQSRLSPFVMCNNHGNAGSGGEEPLHTITSGNRHFLTTPIIAPFITVNTTGSVGNKVDEPTQVIACVDKHFLVSPHISKYFGGNYKGAGTSVDNPIGAITAIDHNALIETHLCILRRGADCRDVQEPLPIITSSGGHFYEVKTYFIKYAEGINLGYWKDVRALLNKHAGYNLLDDEILIIEIGGTSYFISDIEMRMLTPKELYGCQGFPPDYNFTLGGQLSKTEQIKKVGNSVCPPVARALVMANFPECTKRKAMNNTVELSFYNIA